MYFILLETKVASLERMDKIFGGLDFVKAVETEGGSEKSGAMTVVEEEGKAPTAYMENEPQELILGPPRSAV